MNFVCSNQNKVRILCRHLKNIWLKWKKSKYLKLKLKLVIGDTNNIPSVISQAGSREGRVCPYLGG